MWALISASYFNRLSIKLILLFSGLNEPLQHPINRNLLSVVLKETLQVQENNIGFHSASHQRNRKIKKWCVDVFRNVSQRLLHLWQKTEKNE